LKEISFLADESCDFLIVRKLRSADYDVLSVAESFPSASDQQVLEHPPKLFFPFTIVFKYLRPQHSILSPAF